MRDKTEPILSRTDTESLVRRTAYSLMITTERMLSRWQVADPSEKGRLWEEMRKNKDNLKKAINAVEDPKPGQCKHVWFAALDNVWDRCGLRYLHTGDHIPEYMVKSKEEKTNG